MIMRKISLNFSLFAVIGFMAAVFLNSCLEPVSIAEFYAQDNPALINLTTSPKDPLMATFGRIGGLSSGRFYMVMVEELDKNGEPSANPPEFKFVTSAGQLGNALINIGRGATAITGLNNDWRYTIWNASAITDTLTLWDSPPASPASGTSSQVTPNASGILTISAPENTNFLDFAAVDGNSAIVPVTPGGATEAGVFVSGRLIQLRGQGTTTEYVFIDDFDPDSFKFLRVFVEQARELQVNIAFDLEDIAEANLAISIPGPITKASILSGNTFTIQITGSVPSGNSWTATKWYYNGTDTNITANSLNFARATNPDFAIAGKHNFTVEVTINGKQYSKAFTVEVT